MDDPGHEVRTSWRTWSSASILQTRFIFEDHSSAVRNHFPGVSSLWYCYFIQHQSRMWTWIHSFCSFRISTTLRVQHTKELLTANRPCLENAQASCFRWFVVSDSQFCPLGSGTEECRIWEFDTRSQMSQKPAEDRGCFQGFSSQIVT